MAHVAVDEPKDVESFEMLSETLIDDMTLWGRDPFDVIAALEEELGYPINQH